MGTTYYLGNGPEKKLETTILGMEKNMETTIQEMEKTIETTIEEIEKRFRKWRRKWKVLLRERRRD